MQTLYVSRQGCTLALRQDTILVRQQQEVIDSIQLPLLEQLVIFGRSQVTTSVLQACLQRQIPVAYLSHVGYCYGRLMPTQNLSCHWVEAQHAMSDARRLQMAQRMIYAKLHNSRVLLQRQQRRINLPALEPVIIQLGKLARASLQAQSIEQLMGLEGAGAAAYFPALGLCLTNADFTLTRRSRRPPQDPVNALLSFGYQVLWNHVLLAIEMKGLNPYRACLHEPSNHHPALASDLIEQFRAPIIDSVVLYLVNHRMVRVADDFEVKGRACYLSESGRRAFLRAFLQRMHSVAMVGDRKQPQWALLSQQVKALIDCLQRPDATYQPFLIR